MKYLLLLAPFALILYVWLTREFASLLFESTVAIDFAALMLPLISIAALIGIMIDKKM